MNHTNSNEENASASPCHTGVLELLTEAADDLQLVIIPYIAAVTFSDDFEKICNLRLWAIKEIQRYLWHYKKLGYMPKLLCAVARKKYEMLLNLTTKEEIERLIFERRNGMRESKPDRFRNNIHIYIAVGEFLEVCRKLECGELRYLLQNKKKAGDKTPLYQCLGGTSAEKLSKYGRSRPDGKSLSRTAQLLAGSKSDFLFVADSGPGETDAKGLIIPRFGNKPENHVAVSMTFEALSELLLMMKVHYSAWLSAWYSRQNPSGQRANAAKQIVPQYQQNSYEAEYASDPLF